MSEHGGRKRRCLDTDRAPGCSRLRDMGAYRARSMKSMMMACAPRFSASMALRMVSGTLNASSTSHSMDAVVHGRGNRM